METLDEKSVARAIHRLFIGAEDASLRDEDKKKARELAPLLTEAARLLPTRPSASVHIVDAACGKSALGLLVAELICAPRGLAATVTLIERDARALERARAGLARAHVPGVEVELREALAEDPSAWPDAPDLVLALHACGRASDDVIDQAIAHRARHLLLVPCCYGAHPDKALSERSPPGQEVARGWSAAAGMSSHGLIGRRFSTALIDLERTLRLEAAGYETHAVEVFSPTVSPHNLLLRARRSMEAVRMQRAAAKYVRLADGPSSPSTAGG